MSSPKYAAPLRLKPRPSARLAALLLLAHGAALIILPTLALPVWLIAGLAGGVIANFYLTFTTHVLRRGKRALVQLVWEEDGRWTLTTGNGEDIEARLLPGSYVHPWLVILNFACGRRKRSAVLFPDALDPDTFRRLLVRLKIEGNT